ncbi:MAG: hypothetical protein AAFR71_07200 [Pseudomonadota bacterium]
MSKVKFFAAALGGALLISTAAYAAGGCPSQDFCIANPTICLIMGCPF